MENPKKTDKIGLTPEIRDKLIYEYKRTGLGGSAIMRGQRGKYPDGLRSDMIDAWRNGTIKSARKSHLEWLLGRYKQWRPLEETVCNKPEKIEITTEMHDHIAGEQARTRLGAVNILRLAPKPLPDGLNHQKVHRWIAGDTKSALRSHWEFVLRVYKSVGEG